MRRIITIGAALAVLCVAAVAAYATTAPNNYSGTRFTFAPKKAGSRAHPSPLAFTEILSAQPGMGNVRTAPLTDVKTSIYGVVTNPKAFPTCIASKIVAAHTDAGCNPKAMVASGPVNSVLGSTNLAQPGAPCNPLLHVWNGGPGKLVFFFVTNAAHSCGSLHTGDTPPYMGFVKRMGPNLVTDVPEPPFISTSVAFHPGLYGSLIREVLTFRRLTTKIHGRTVGYNASVACKHGKRPWSIKFTTNNNGLVQSKTVSGASKC